MIITSSLFFTASILCIYSSFTILLKDFKSKIFQFFSLYSFLISIWLLSWGCVFFIDQYTLLITRLMVLPTFFIPLVFNMFCNQLNKKPRWLTIKEKVIHGISVFILMLFSFSPYNITTAHLINGNLDFSYGHIYTYFGGYLLSGMSYGIYLLYSGSFKLDYHGNQRSKYLILGTALGTLNGLVFAFIMPAIGIVFLNKFSTLSSLWVVFVSKHAITSKRLMNLNVFISKLLSYGITSTFFSSVLIITIYLKSQYYPNIELSNVTVFICTLLFGSIFIKFQTIVEMTSFIKYLKQNNIQHFNKKILCLYNDCFDIEGVIHKTKQFFKSNLAVRNSVIFIKPELLSMPSANTLVNFANISEQLSLSDNYFNKVCIYTDSHKNYFNMKLKYLVEKNKTKLIINIFDIKTPIMSIFLTGSDKYFYNSIDPEVFYLLSAELNKVLARIIPYEKVKKQFVKSKHMVLSEVEQNLIQEIEYSIAKNIQKRCLPKEELTTFNFDIDFVYHPSNAIGGDFFDIMPLGKEKVGILLCDNLNDGLDSVFSTIQLHSIFRSQVKYEDTPKKVMANLNNSLYQLGIKDNIYSAFYLEIETKRHIIKYSDVGNGLCYLLRNGKLISLSDFGGKVLGNFKNSTYTEGEIQLKRNDILFFACKGILNVENADKEYFDILRLEDLILNMDSQNEIKEYVYKEINSFIGNTSGLSRDITLIMISNKSRVVVNTLHK